MFTLKTKLVITCFYIVHCMLCLITNQKIKRKTYILNFVLVYCDKLRAYSDVRVFSAAEILLRIYKNPIHLNGKRWPTVGELHAASKTSSANGSHLNVCDFAVSAAEFPQQKKTCVFGLNRPLHYYPSFVTPMDTHEMNIQRQTRSYRTSYISKYLLRSLGIRYIQVLLYIVCKLSKNMSFSAKAFSSVRSKIINTFIADDEVFKYRSIYVILCVIYVYCCIYFVLLYIICQINC